MTTHLTHHDSDTRADAIAARDAAVGWLIDERVADEAARFGKRYDELTADERRQLEDEIAPGVFGLVTSDDEQVTAWRALAQRQNRGTA